MVRFTSSWSRLTPSIDERRASASEDTASALLLLESAVADAWATEPDSWAPYCARVEAILPNGPAALKLAFTVPTAASARAPRLSPMLSADWPAVAVRSSLAIDRAMELEEMSDRTWKVVGRCAIRVESMPNSLLTEGPPAPL